MKNLSSTTGIFFKFSLLDADEKLESTFHLSQRLTGVSLPGNVTWEAVQGFESRARTNIYCLQKEKGGRSESTQAIWYVLGHLNHKLSRETNGCYNIFFLEGDLSVL